MGREQFWRSAATLLALMLLLFCTASANLERHRPGYGAKAWGTFKFEENTQLRVVVGQAGTNAPNGFNTANMGGAGGGGTFVYKLGDTEPLVAAGGGASASAAVTIMVSTRKLGAVVRKR